MTGEDKGRERPAAATVPNSDKHLSGTDSRQGARQDRLKLALRENLKRRKSQARGRHDLAAETSEAGGTASYDEGGQGR
ncbi:MAG TPA: hypothetical protein VHB49_20085 [Bradyrhizobium sp.]|nr:hypothetical protein [Bradyrhizobium sp.]